MRPVVINAALQAAIDSSAARDDMAVEDLTRMCLERIEALNPRLNSFVVVAGDRAVANARAADRRRQRRPLEGVVLAVKDNIAVTGLPLTAGSLLYAGYHPARSATAVRRLVDAGAIVIGKTNLHELAMGSTSDNPFFGPCRNPWDLARSPGGSSGGSAAAVAADLCVAALGTDTGGSIRNPAAICGVTGLRPTFGVISNRGVVPVAPSFDTVGAIARSARDVLALHRAMGGLDDGAVGHFEHLTIGIAENEYYEIGVAEPVRTALQDVRRWFGELGMRTVDLPIEGLPAAEAMFLELLKGQAAASHDVVLRQHPERFSEPLRRLLVAGSLTTGQIAEKMAHVEGWRTRVIDRAFSRCDALLTPLQLAPPLEFSDSGLPAAAGKAMRFTFPWSLARLPALSLPCGAFPDGMPIGCQLVGPPLSDALLLDIGVRFQQSTAWHLRRPPLDSTS